MEYVDNTEPPKSYHLWTAIMTLAAVLKRKVWIHWGINEKLYPNMFVVLVGPAGRCRKGTAMKIGQSMLQSLGVNVAPSSVTREALIGRLQDSTTSEITKDGAFLSHASLTVWSPEWSVFMGGRENMQLIMDLTDWFDCPDSWDYVTKNSGSNNISGVWVNMFGAITPSTIKSVLPFEAVGAGLSSRIIFVYEANAAKRVPDPFETPELQALGKVLVQDLTDIHSLSGEFEISANGMEFYRDWYMNMEKTNPKMPEMFDGYLNRRQTHLRKLAMIVSISESNDMKITEAHFRRALDLLERTEVRMPRTFASIGTDKDSQLKEDMMNYIAKHRNIPAAQIFRDFRSFLSGPRHLDELITGMVQMGFITQDVTRSGVIINYIPNNPLDKQYGQQSSNRSSNTP